MKTTLLKNVPKGDQEAVRSNFKNSSLVRQILLDRINEKIQEQRSQTISRECYNTPNWAYLQADQAGFERALLWISTLIK